MLEEAEQAWEPAIGGSWPVAVNVLVQPLPAGRLGETIVTSWAADEDSSLWLGSFAPAPDAAGQGWFIDDRVEDPGNFPLLLSSTASAAVPGSNAYGGYDLLTTLEHELGHILAFDPSNPGYESHLRTENGSQVFVGADFTLPVAPGGENSTLPSIPMT